MPFRLSSNSLKHREGVDRRLIEISDLAINITRVDFGHGVHAGKRTAEEQHELYLADASKCDGYCKRSFHQSGLALDFYAYVDGAATWEEQHLAQVAAAFLQAASMLGYELHWGGLWEDWQDMPHVQLTI